MRLAEAGMTDLVVRELRAEDVAACADLHVRSFPGFFLSELGPRFLREFYRGFLGDPTALTVVALSADGSLQGVVVGTTSPHGFFSRLLRRRLLGFALASVLVVLRRPTAAPRLLKAALYRGQVPVEVDGALLSSICVEPSSQARGTGSVLISRFRDLAHSAGMGAYLVTDRDGNEAANAFYERKGWRLLDCYETPEGRKMNCYALSAPGENR